MSLTSVARNEALLACGDAWLELLPTSAASAASTVTASSAATMEIRRETFTCPP
jgi:hypothetical protein